jgi:alpha-L-rhamnosidase
MTITMRRIMGWSFLVGLSFLLSAEGSLCRAESQLHIQQLKCENRAEPRGVDPRHLHFCWQLLSPHRGDAQTAWEIALASSRRLLNQNEADLWRSGRMESSEAVSVPYRGKELAGGEEYYWKVRVWDGKGDMSNWSDAASFVTALNPDQWGGARWIGYEVLPASLRQIPGIHGNGDKLGMLAKQRPAVPLFRREFEIRPGLGRALLFISGLGHYEASLNGAKVGNDFLAPGWTLYSKTCLYNIYTVTDLLHEGRNALGVVVGNGFFNINREYYRKLVIAFGNPMLKLKLQLEYENGQVESITSDSDWKTAVSPITFSSIYGGEQYDAQMEQPGWDRPGFAEKGWKPVVMPDGPDGALKPELASPLKIMQEFSPVKILQPKPGIYVYDFGQNVSGILRLKTRGARGRQIRLLPAELLNKNGLINQKASGEPYLIAYTLKGDGEEIWQPRFTYYGARYVQVEGAVPSTNSAGPSNLPLLLNLQLLHTRYSGAETGSFQCSSDLFNRIFELIRWGIRGNLASVPTDCPHREKLGWLEQSYLMGPSIFYNYDIYGLYQKLMDDILDSALPHGLVPDIAPEFVPFEEGFRDSPEWGSAAVILPWLMYRWYGDTTAMERSYSTMSAYIGYLRGKSRGGILSHGLGDWFDLGPKPPGPSQLTPMGLTATAIYYHDLDLLSQMAQILGKAEDAQAYREQAAGVKKAFNEAFFDATSAIYATGSQTSQAMPYCLGLVPEESRGKVIENLVHSIRKNGNALTAGDIGFHFVLKALQDAGTPQVIYDMNSRSDVPGYGFQLAKGATSLTESWEAREDVSNNHMMLGHLMEWLFSGLAGIRQDKDSTGFKTIVIAPQPVGDIQWAKAKFNSPRGEIVADWKREGTRFELKVKVPVGSKAIVVLPAQRWEDVLESGRPAQESETVRWIGIRDQKAQFEIGSGEYDFVASR